MSDVVKARERILGGSSLATPYTGSGVTIAMMDSGLGSGPATASCFGTRFLNFASAQRYAERSLVKNDHAMRILSLCAGGAPEGASKQESIGIAPDARVVSAIYDATNASETCGILGRISRELGKIHISGHPYSTRESYEMSLSGRAAFRNLAGDEWLGHLVVAAAGHDPEYGVRFPAIAESVLAVGVHDADENYSAYCGRTIGEGKPDFVLPNLAYAAIDEKGNPSSINGTSAAVGVFCGLAALWCEYLFGLRRRRKKARRFFPLF